MNTNRTHTIRDAVLKHGRILNKTPDDQSGIKITQLSSGGMMLNQGATRALLALIQGDDDLVLVDRYWMRKQLIRIGVAAGDTDLLLDNITTLILPDMLGLRVQSIETAAAD